MKIEQIPFKMSTTINEHLRDIPDDIIQMRQGIDWLSEQLTQIDLESLEAAGILTLRGSFSRVVMDLDLAHEDLKRAHHVFEIHGKKPQAMVTQIRLGHVLHWKERFSEAFSLFKKLAFQCQESEIDSLQKYLDYVYQHHGKCCLDAGRVQEGLDYLLMAHALRVEKGDLDLIASSEQAILYARDLLQR